MGVFKEMLVDLPYLLLVQLKETQENLDVFTLMCVDLSKCHHSGDQDGSYPSSMNALIGSLFICCNKNLKCLDTFLNIHNMLNARQVKR